MLEPNQLLVIGGICSGTGVILAMVSFLIVKIRKKSLKCILDKDYGE